MKRIVILGSTGSIGKNALDVIGNNPRLFEVAGLAAGRNLEGLREQILRFRPPVVSVIDEDHARRLREMLPASEGVAILSGREGACEVASLPGADMALSAMVGSAGLLPTLAAIDAGKDIALANKETLVMAGSLVMERAAARGVRILPVDSEHSAIFQCLAGNAPGDVKRIILTASGGPFLHMPKERLAEVTPAQALRHPNWAMGPKITIDSASMMNKGLEIIEAKWLFQVDLDQIRVVIHPQSIVHSLVEYRDGSVLAQLGLPDMRGPIAYALSYPERVWRPPSCLDLVQVGRLEFFDPDPERFPNLTLACKAAREGGTLPAVLNGANEVAVEAFLASRIGFSEMPRLIGAVLDRHARREARTVEDVLEADRWAREEAGKMIGEVGLC